MSCIQPSLTEIRKRADAIKKAGFIVFIEFRHDGPILSIRKSPDIKR